MADSGNLGEEAVETVAKNENVEKRTVSDDWRIGLKSAKACKLRMLERGIHSDCTFVVGPENGETQEFRAHRLPLICLSPVFEAMFEGETSEATSGRVRITDIEPNVFSLLLSYAYVNETNLYTRNSLREANALALVADKYQMTILFEECINYLCMKMRPDGVWCSLATARILDNKQLLIACLQGLQRNTVGCLKAEDFLDIDEASMEVLLSQDTLNVESEMLLVSVTVNWARHEAQKRGLAGDDAGVRTVLEPRLLKLLRLLTISPEQFALGPGLSGWLTDQEKKQIQEFHKTKNVNSVSAEHVSDIVLQRYKNNLARFENINFMLCRGEIESNFTTEITTDPIFIFSIVDKNLKLLSVGLVSKFTLNNMSSQYPEHLVLHVLTQRNSNWVHVGHASYTGPAPVNSTITIVFPHAIDITKNTKYVLQVKLDKSKKRKYGLMTELVSNAGHVLIHKTADYFVTHHQNFFTVLNFCK